MDKTSLLNFLSNFGHPLIPMQLFRRLAKHKMQVLNQGERGAKRLFLVNLKYVVGSLFLFYSRLQCWCIIEDFDVPVCWMHCYLKLVIKLKSVLNTANKQTPLSLVTNNKVM